jgi:hypothetical protein
VSVATWVTPGRSRDLDLLDADTADSLARLPVPGTPEIIRLNT